MYNGGKIIFGLAVFVAMVTFPFYYNAGTVVKKPDPKIDTPAIQQLADKKCIEPKDFMITEHMQLLTTWRDEALRDNNHVYVNSQGRQFTISLQNTCMHCHSNKKEFCDQCHNFMGVSPYCWSCHLEPKENKL